jgi:hypothetical protein
MRREGYRVAVKGVGGGEGAPVSPLQGGEGSRDTCSLVTTFPLSIYNNR